MLPRRRRGRVWERGPDPSRERRQRELRLRQPRTVQLHPALRKLDLELVTLPGTTPAPWSAWKTRTRQHVVANLQVGGVDLDSFSADLARSLRDDLLAVPVDLQAAVETAEEHGGKLRPGRGTSFTGIVRCSQVAPASGKPTRAEQLPAA